MTAEKLKDLFFYCWQLNIKTAGDLWNFKKQHGATNNSQTLAELAKAYNGKEWEQANGLTD